MTFPDVTFASPLWLWGMWTVPALIALFFWAERQSTRKLALLMRSPRLRAQLTGAASPGRRRGRYALMLLGLSGLLLAMAGPRWGYEAQQIRRKGLDLLLMVDVSKSMLATDLTPNRLTRAKLSAQDLLSQLQGDRVGLVAFAGTAFLQAPLTVDYDAALAALRDLDTDTIPRGGTNLEAAINLAIEAFGKAEADNRAIVLLSDGEATEGESASGLKAAARAAETGIKIFTVGLGTTEGSLLPLPGGTGEFVRDRDGQMVRSKLNEAGLEEIAKAAGGFYVHLQNGQAEMRAVVEKGLGQMKTGEIDARQSHRPIERYQWPLGAALLSLGLSALIGERRKARAPASGVASGGVAAVPNRQAAAVALGMALGVIGMFAGHVQAAPAPPGKDPMALYRDGRYNEAYQGFKDLAKTNPDADRLHFDAGASAYMSGKYDDALNAFGEAMTSRSPDLQAMSHYNFGNTLYKRGSAQRDRQIKIKDWRNAVEHYDNALNLLKTRNNQQLAQDTAYNRDLLLKMLEEEEKPQPTPPPQQQQQQQKQDPKQSKSKQDQKDQQKQDQKQDPKDQKQDQKDQKQGGQQQQQKSDQQRQQQQSKSEQPGSAQPNDQNGNSNTPPQPQDPSGQSKDQKKDDSTPQGGKSDQPTQNQPQKPSDQGQNANNPPPPEPGKDSPSPSESQPDPSSVPNQDQPRQRGDFKAQPGEQSGEKPSGEKGDQVAQELNESEKPEEGKMNAAQARALLEALKGEDDHVSLNDHADRRNEPAINDW